MADAAAGIGDKLYQLVLEHYSDAATAGKLTGMLMDAMAPEDLQRLMGDGAALKGTLAEAHEALVAAAGGAGTTEPAAPAPAPTAEEVEDGATVLPPPSTGEEAAAASAAASGGPDKASSATAAAEGGKAGPAATGDEEAAEAAEAEPKCNPPAGPKALLNAIKWHPGITFADVFVDFRKRKSSGKLSRRVTGSPFIAFSFGQLDKVDDEQIEQVLWKNTPVYQKSRTDAPIQGVDVDVLGLTAAADLEQAAMVNEIVAGRKARRSEDVEKVASGQAKFEPIGPEARAKLRRQRAEEDAPTLLEHLAQHNVDPADINLTAEALQKYYTAEQLSRAAHSVASWADKIDEFCWSKGHTRFVFATSGDGEDDTPAGALYKCTEFGKSGFALELMGRRYTNIWVQHRFHFDKRINMWTLGFHHLESGSRLECSLTTPGAPRQRDAGGDDWRDGEWTMEVWAVTNFPLGETTKRLMDACKSLPGNCITHVGKPE